MSTDEIVLPLTAPETEWVRGRALRKVSPTRDHARVQSRFAWALDAWAGTSGEVGTEWRFRLSPPGEVRRPLVPDIAFVRVERLRGRSHADVQAPEFPPNVVVEVLSPGDDPSDLEDKIGVYLRAGVDLVIVLDPASRSLESVDRCGRMTFAADDVFTHVALPGFQTDVGRFYAAAIDLPAQ